MLRITEHTTLIRKLPSPIYKLAAQAFIDKGFPRHIFIETTASCQLSCEYCPREKRNENMDFELFKSIIDECSEYGARSFSLHLFGEVLLYPKILEAMDYIKTKNKKHTILLTTNGILLNRFNDKLDNADRIIWTYRKNNFNDSSIELLKKKGIIRLLIEETPKEEFEKWKTFPRVEIKHLHNYAGQIDTTKWNLEENANPDWRYPCYHLWLAPAIRWNGDITICCNDPHGKETVGNYQTLSLHEAWTGSNFMALRKGHLKGEYKGICKNCNVWKTYPDLFFDFQKKHTISDKVVSKMAVGV